MSGPTGEYIPPHIPAHAPTPGAEHFPSQPAHTFGSEQFSPPAPGYQPPQWNPADYPPYGAPPASPYQQPLYPAGQHGQGYPPQYVPGMNPFDPWAIASLVLSLVGIPLLGIIFGHVALVQIKRTNGYERGRGLAIAGLIIGYAEIALGLIILIGIALSVIALPASQPTPLP